MDDMKDLISRLNQTGKRLSKSHRLIEAYIVAHYDKAVFMTASVLGQNVGVSESTVVRFATAMGYDGYPEMQQALQELVRHRLTSQQRLDMSTGLGKQQVLETVLKSDMNNMRSTMEELDPDIFDRVVERILGAKAIYILGLRSAAPLAQFLGYYLHYIFDDVRIVSSGTGDVFEDISRIGREDVLIGISFPRYSTRTLEAMRFARQRGAQVVGITDGVRSPMMDITPDCLTARTDMASFVDSLAAPLSVINALVVALGLQRPEELREHFRHMESIWDEYKVYIKKENE